ncbi:hypothetical protein F4678DRAFT_339938 [Xylaria arbuscula]|nr:hypothetical protein F4678DRAFT_339938 [Xylaria arbuscula]
MVGLKSCKRTMSKLAEQPRIGCSLNKVLVGDLGMGKTTVVKLYGRTLAVLGLLSNGEVVIKGSGDFIGSALRQFENNTKEILEAAKGRFSLTKRICSLVHCPVQREQVILTELASST